MGIATGNHMAGIAMTKWSSDAQRIEWKRKAGTQAATLARRKIRAYRKYQRTPAGRQAANRKGQSWMTM